MIYTNKEDKTAYNRAWEAANPDKVRAKSARYRTKNPEKRRASVAAHRAANPGSGRKSTLWTGYRMTVEQFDAMLASQGGRCAICLTDTPGARGWHVDHDHAKQRGAGNRGLLCHHCNLCLGNARDNPETLRRAATYLESHK